MSKKESNHMPAGTVRPPAPIKTDNSAVIRTLEKRIAELEKVAEAAEHFYMAKSYLYSRRPLREALEAALPWIRRTRPASPCWRQWQRRG